ncbi:hypothetical protein FANTH_2595 [Fusarium anthophilum]|uniref:Cystathionine gamma-synthase n=1 Tax=Fusarium anthophilum TaxID=48485 RepID=A0A8H4ZTT0_9HYPO|nr:hypothetical protein FANTH_2595 [Fusarium anthophilum]
MAPPNRNWVYPNSLKALPLHEPHIYPPGTPHAISSSLPTWQSVRDLAKLVDRTQVDINYSYPRYYFGWHIRTLVQQVRQRLGPDSNHLDCYIFPSSEDADDYVAQFREKRVTARHVRFQSSYSASTSTSVPLYLAFSALLLPPGNTKHVLDIWENLGTGITTRHAQYCLDHFYELKSTESTTPTFLHQKSATSDVPHLKAVKARDVFIFPNGMNAIYNTSEAIAINNPGRRVVTFGWIYHETMKNLHRGQWKEVIPFPLGGEEDLDRLESMLNPNAKRIYAVFCELPSNSKLTSPNLERLGRIARDHDLLVVCDETVGNFVNVDLLPHVDILTTSLTKMFSGAANVTGGSVIVNPNSRHYDVLHEAIRSRYQTVSCFPMDISVLRENSMNMVERVKRADATTLDVIKVFTDHSAVARVIHPSRAPELRNYRRHRRQDGGYGNVFSLVFKNPGAAEHFYDHLDVCKGASFGTNFTIAIPFVQLTASNDDERENIDQHGLLKHMIRISVGLEDSRQICDKMTAALAKVEKF